MKPQPEEARPKPRVCRRLFADDDPAEQGLHDNMFNQITEQINRNLDDACKKYNFDFRTEVPLEGDWAWERIGDDDTPQARAEPLTTAPDTTGPGVESEGASLQPPASSDAQCPPGDVHQPPSVPQ